MPPLASKRMYFSAKRPNNFTASLGSTKVDSRVDVVSDIDTREQLVLLLAVHGHMGVNGAKAAAKMKVEKAKSRRIITERWFFL